MRAMNRLVVLILLTVFAVSSYSVSAASELAGYTAIAENQYLTLFINEETTEIAVYDQRTGEFWYSNPVNRSKVETIARGAAKDALSSQLKIVYYAPGDVQRTMDNYNDSIVYEQYEIELIDNGARIVYVLGKEWEDQYYLPLIVEQELFESEFFAHLDSAQQRTISGLYALVEIVEPAADVKPTIVDKYIIHAPAGGLAARDEKTIHNVFLDHLVAYKSNLTKAAEVRLDDVEPFVGKPFYILKQRDRDMLPWDKTAIIDITREAGFDPYLIGAGYELYNMEAGQPNLVIFTIPIEYRLEDDNLVVSIITEGIEYPQQIKDSEGQSVTYPLVQIGLLPYFGAAEIGSDGYMFVPDGSGSLIHFDNEKVHLSAYNRRIYGQDYAVGVPSSTVLTYPVTLPVFGLKKDANGLFAIVEQGATIARINADVSGRRISYNTIYPSFDVIERTTSSLQGDMPDIHRASAQWVVSGGGTVNVYQDPMYNGQIQVRYGFLADAQSGYVGMAHYYQDYLVAKGALTPRAPQENIPLMIDLVGALADRQPVLGIQRDVIIPMTSYKQAGQIVQELLDNKISNISLSYIGWMRNGIDASYPDKVRLEPNLGTTADMKDLIQFTKTHGVNLYPDLDFLNIYNDTLFDGFLSTRDASRSLTRNVAFYGGYLLSPAKLGQLVDKYLKSQAAYGFSGIQLWDLASQLHGDYRRGANVTREEALNIIRAQLTKITGDYNLKVQAYCPNDYALPYIESIIGFPLDHSGMDIVDEAVPFGPILLHGFIDYAGEPLNYSAYPGDYLLKMIETGANPYFTAFYQEPSLLKGSLYDSYYSGQFAGLSHQIKEVYDVLNGIFKDVQDEIISDHCQLQPKVFETVFANGKRIIVNYNEVAVTADGHDIGPKNFVVFEGE